MNKLIILAFVMTVVFVSLVSSQSSTLKCNAKAAASCATKNKGPLTKAIKSRKSPDVCNAYKVWKSCLQKDSLLKCKSLALVAFKALEKTAKGKPFHCDTTHSSASTNIVSLCVIVMTTLSALKF